MSAQCKVMEVSEVKPKTIIGQIHGSANNSELLKIRWTGYKPGKCAIEARFQTNDDMGSEYGVVLASGLSLGDIINYTVTMTQGVVNVMINGNSANQTYTSAYYGTTDQYYFKAGNYIQWNETIVGESIVYGENRFYSLSLERAPLAIQNQSINQFMVYPNPTKDYVLLNLDLKTQSNTIVEIIDAKGTLVEKKVLSPVQLLHHNANRINIENLSSGNYIMRITADKRIEKRKLVISK